MRRHSSQRARLTALAAVALLSFSTSGHAQNSSITTKLMGRIDSRRIAEGHPSSSKQSPMETGTLQHSHGCDVGGPGRKGGETRPRREARRNRLALSATALPGNDETQEVTPILVAMHGPKLNSNDNMLAQEWISSLFAATAGSHAPGPGSSSGGLPAPPGALGRNTGTLGKGAMSLRPLAKRRSRRERCGTFPP